MSIEWLRPEDCAPPHRVTRPRLLDALVTALATDGWKLGAPVLLGYTGGPHITPESARVQLISGSHRWAAALEVGARIPVKVMDYEDVYRTWGTPEWVEMLSHPPRLDSLAPSYARLRAMRLLEDIP